MAESAEQPKRARGARSEGNYVRLNINGYGRKRTFRNAQARRPTKYRSWRRQQAGGAKPQACGNEEGDFVAEALMEREKKGMAVDDGVLEAVEAAREDSSKQNLENFLRVAYGYDSFPEGQLEAIQKIVAGESAMLVLPTGAGKSLCYQVPAMILPGLTLVVSPLLSLMADQLRKLPAFLPGGLLASSQKSDEFHETLQKLRGGEIKMLFVSPERKLNVQCVLAMTATATIQTLEEIVNALEIPSDNLIKKSQIRENLQLSISMSDNRLKDLMLLLKASPFVNMKSIIVYCKFQGEADYVGKYLCDNNITAKIMKLDAMFALANCAVKGCQRTDGCSGSQHTPCIQKKITEYFSKHDGISENGSCSQLQKTRCSFICKVPPEGCREDYAWHTEPSFPISHLVEEPLLGVLCGD